MESNSKLEEETIFVTPVADELEGKLPLRLNYQPVPPNHYPRVEFEELALAKLKVSQNSARSKIIILYGDTGYEKVTLARKIVQLSIDNNLFGGNNIWIECEGRRKNFDNRLELTEAEDLMLKFIGGKFPTTPCLIVFDNVRNPKEFQKIPNMANLNLCIVAITKSSWHYRGVVNIKLLPMDNFEFATFVRQFLPDLAMVDITRIAEHTKKSPQLAELICRGYSELKELDKNHNLDSHLQDKMKLCGATCSKLFSTQSEIKIVGRELELISEKYRCGELARKVMYILSFCEPLTPISETGLENSKSFQSLVSKIKMQFSEAMELVTEILMAHGFLGSSQQVGIPYFQKLVREMLRKNEEDEGEANKIWSEIKQEK